MRMMMRKSVKMSKKSDLQTSIVFNDFLTDGTRYVVESIMDHQSDFPDVSQVEQCFSVLAPTRLIRMKYDTSSNGKVTKRSPTVRGKPKKTFSKALFVHLSYGLANLICLLRGARDILKEYWAKLGGKPIAENKSASKKRARQSRGSDTPDSSSTKKQKKAGRKSKDAGVKLEDDAVPDGTLGFTEVGDDDWKPPKVKKESWDDKVQSVDTIEKDDQGVLWAYLLWNDKSEDGRYYRSKAKLSSCKEACPQRVGSTPMRRYVPRATLTLFFPDAGVLRETRVSP